LFSNAGVVVSHPNKSFIGKNITEVMPKLEEEFHILNSMQNGNQFSFTSTDEYKNLGKITTIFIPIQIGDNNEKKWSLGVVMPNDMIFSKANKIEFISIVIFIIALLILSALIWVIATKISKAINTIITRLSKIFNVYFTQDGKVKSNYEIDIINEFNEYLNNLSNYETLLVSNLIPQSNLITESATKLVSIFNATIEAARTGKKEKGFAIIANEVKELVEGSTKAIKGISDLIINIQSYSNKVNKVIKEIILVTNKITSMEEITKYIFDSVEQQTMFTSEILQQFNKIYEGTHLIPGENDEVINNLTIYVKVFEDLTNCATYLSKLASDLSVGLKDFQKE
jgi:methyl-accepting chemotaxis protein